MNGINEINLSKDGPIGYAKKVVNEYGHNKNVDSLDLVVAIRALLDYFKTLPSPAGEFKLLSDKVIELTRFKDRILVENEQLRTQLFDSSVDHLNATKGHELHVENLTVQIAMLEKKIYDAEALDVYQCSLIDSKFNEMLEKNRKKEKLFFIRYTN